ncbi:MAG TPA: cytochrome o ubiquinol oxidase subunit IV [Candidatus Saccharimonadales bacterium]|nr:cytochrome o ubiquinol oxidase subunit IV [Candidatus Saccharimonadales bacterium]
MSNEVRIPKVGSHHGTVASYVIGFVLSLIFTLVPYYLLVHKTFGKNALIVTILVFAVLQMAVQMLFFLHLGREKKPRFNLAFLGSTVSIILLIIVGSLWIMSHLYHGMSAMNVTDKVVTDEAIYQVNGVQAGTCPGGTGKNYEVMMMDGRVTPDHIEAHVCDTLIIVNHDSPTRNIIYGSGNNTETYAGQPGPSIPRGQSAAISLTEPGTYTFHDKTLSTMSGAFTVTQK